MMDDTFLHDIGNALAIVEGMLHAATRELKKDSPDKAVVEQKIQKAQASVKRIVDTLKAYRESKAGAA